LNTPTTEDHGGGTTTEHEAWLELTNEQPIEPDLPICDPHHHLWDHPNSRYLLDELLRDIGGGHNIIQTVFVECSSMYRKGGPEEMRPVGETEFVQGIAAQSASGDYGETEVAAGIVGFADLTLGAAVAPVLEAQKDASRNRFRGIRHASAWDADPGIRAYKSPRQGLWLEAKFQEGFACLEPAGLSFDAWLYHPQIVDLVGLARVNPGVSIVLDHVGGPIGIGTYEGKQDEVVRVWEQAISELAACPNVSVKLGGLGMTFCGFGWHRQTKPPDSTELARVMAPYFNHCIESFGVDRCMFESNFPVDKASYSYTVMWNAFKRVCADFSTTERAALFHDTAARFYRLSE